MTAHSISSPQTVMSTNNQVNPETPTLTLEGSVKQCGEIKGFFPDQWIGKKLIFSIQTQEKISRFNLQGYAPEPFNRGNCFKVKIGNYLTYKSDFNYPSFCLDLPVYLSANQVIEIEIEAQKTWNLKQEGMGEDERELSFHMVKIMFQSPTETSVENSNQQAPIQSTTTNKEITNWKNPFPDGHFYSPVINLQHLKQSEEQVWTKNPEIVGIDFNATHHQYFLNEVFPQYIQNFDYPLTPSSPHQYSLQNGQFSWLDAKTLFVMLQHLRPQRMIEIGSGYSSLLTADVNQRFLKQQLQFTCIEPYPREFLLTGVPGITRLIHNKVEDVPLSVFSELKRGDILFIDSSHVCKTGSDVNYIYFEIIPRLQAGVYIHIHDLFFPHEYPKKWVLEEGRSWNEQYLVRALLMYTQAFEVIFGSNFAVSQYPELVKQALQGQLQGGSSFWLRKTISYTPAPSTLNVHRQPETPTQEKTASFYFTQGNKLSQEGKLEEAINAYQKAVELNLKTPWIYHNLGNAFKKKGHLEKAITAHQKAIQLNPNSALFYHNLGETLAQAGKLEDALEQFNQALKINPHFAQSHHQIGKTLEQQGKLDAAIIAYRRASELSPSIREFQEHLNKAIARKDTLTSPSLSPSNTDQVILNISKLALKSDEIKPHLKAIENQPNNPALYFEMGKTLSKQGELEEAVNAYLKALQIQPHFSAPYRYLLNAQLQPDQLNKAIAIYRQAIQTQTNFIPAYINLGYSLTQKGDLEAATSCYQTAAHQQTLMSHPQFVEQHWNPNNERKPHFLIIGAEKCGTSSLYLYLIQHPQILAPVEKEIHFFTYQFKNGLDWYSSHFPPIPKSAPYITGEASTSYIGCHNHAEQKVFDLFPHVKLMALLRNPVDRAISQYHQVVRLGREKRSLEQAMQAELEILNSVENPLSVRQIYWQNQRGYLWNSLYLYFLEKWMALFPREQLLILSSENFYSQPQTAMKQVFDFLNLPEHQLSDYPKYNAGSYNPLDESMRKTLSAFFRLHNQKLEERLGIKFNWES